MESYIRKNYDKISQEQYLAWWFQTNYELTEIESDIEQCTEDKSDKNFFSITSAILSGLLKIGSVISYVIYKNMVNSGIVILVSLTFDILTYITYKQGKKLKLQRQNLYCKETALEKQLKLLRKKIKIITAKN